jgi:hypothetical protein
MTITVRIVFPTPGMPGQNNIRFFTLSQVWYSAESRIHQPVPGCRLFKKSLYSAEDHNQPALAN